MNFRIRGPSGQATLTGVEESTTVAQFLSLLEEKTGLKSSTVEILAGFPPKLISLPDDIQTATVSSLGIQAGDNLTVRQGASSITNDQSTISLPSVSPAVLTDHSAYSVAHLSEDEQLAHAIAASLGQSIDTPIPASSQQQQQPVKPPPLATNKGDPSYENLPDGTAIARRIVADDNSCLFSAVGYVIKGSRSTAPALRSIVADAVLLHPHEWNEAVLGKDPKEYSKWIQDPKKWGGAIELSIFSKQFEIEIAAFDIQTKRVDIYGQENGYEKRVLLVYDGLHYDALAHAKYTNAPESLDTTQFRADSTTMDMIMKAAANLVERFHSARQFTDTANFALRCGVCNIGLKGEKEAVQHAHVTGHANFTEY